MTAATTYAYRRAYSHWLRTGRWLRPFGTDGRELKFNPYHDPRNGQFTFAPGGPRSLSRIVVSDRQGQRSWIEGQPSIPIETGMAPGQRSTDRSEPDSDLEAPTVQLAAASNPPRMPRGGNRRAFDDPITLEQAFPGLRSAPGGAIVAVADNLLDLSGPARALTSALTEDISRSIVKDIQTLNPKYLPFDFGPSQTLDGQLNALNNLRYDRAATYYRFRGDLRPLQVETLRFVQARTDFRYDEALRLLKAGRLPIRLSQQEALGNYIDRRVREDLRRRLNVAGIDWTGRGPVRVNKRENDSSPSEQVFRRPDFRIDRVAYDVTLANKTLRDRQVRGFFSTDFQPIATVMIRPSRLGENHTYAISRPEK